MWLPVLNGRSRDATRNANVWGVGVHKDRGGDLVPLAPWTVAQVDWLAIQEKDSKQDITGLHQLSFETTLMKISSRKKVTKAQNGTNLSLVAASSAYLGFYVRRTWRLNFQMFWKPKFSLQGDARGFSKQSLLATHWIFPLFATILCKSN